MDSPSWYHNLTKQTIFLQVAKCGALHKGIFCIHREIISSSNNRGLRKDSIREHAKIVEDSPRKAEKNI